MKKIAILLLLVTTAVVSAQKATSDDNIYALTGIEVKPEFPGGMSKLNEFLSTTGIETDASAKVNLIAVFVVEKDGTLTDVQVLGKTKPGNSADIVAKLKTSPKWTPGKVNGKIVRVKYTLPLIHAK